MRATIVLRCPSCRTLYAAEIAALQQGEYVCTRCATIRRWRAQIAAQEAAWRRTPQMRLRRMLRLPDPPRPKGTLLVAPHDDIVKIADADLYRVEIYG